MDSPQLPLPQLFKGIALFTPGGDFFYCIDPDKQGRWHLHLCASVQELLGLSEPPHFLVPCYGATLDRWLDPRTGQVKVFAEAAPAVLRYQVLLNAVFGMEGPVWQRAAGSPELCDPLVLETYRPSFPQLWEDHDLVVHVEATSRKSGLLSPRPVEVGGYVLHLFIRGHSVMVERTLQSLHQLLDESLGQPYTLKVIDVLKHPEQAEADRVSATPTLIRVWPRPVRRVVGELDNLDKILGLLGSPNRS